jgi:hypothetical protein
MCRAFRGHFVLGARSLTGHADGLDLASACSGRGLAPVTARQGVTFPKPFSTPGQHSARRRTAAPNHEPSPDNDEFTAPESEEYAP